MQPTPYRLRAAMQFLRYRFHSLAIPAARHHACMHNPIGRPVSARCQFAHLLLFFVIVRCSHSQDLRHCLAPSPELTSFLILSPFHERSTSFHCEIESAWEGASRHQSVDGLCHFCCDSPHPSRAVSAGAACGAGSISQWKLVLVSIAK